MMKKYQLFILLLQFLFSEIIYSMITTKKQLYQAVGPHQKLIIESFQQFQRKDPCPADIQREYTDERIDEFFLEIQKYRQSLENQKTLIKYPVPFLNPLHIAHYRDKYLIIDGQHRYFAYQKFYQQTPEVNFSLCYILYECSTHDEVIAYFKGLNNNFDMIQMVFNDDESYKMAISLKSYLKEKYKTHISNSYRPQFPNVHLYTVVDFFIMNPVPEVENILTDSDTLINNFENYNKKLGQKLKKTHPELYLKAIKKEGLFIASMIQQINRSSTKIKRRKRITKALRQNVWEEYQILTKNHQFLKGDRCYCCQRTKINTFDFECGHRIAHVHGGETQLNNLRPLCRVCNNSMGTTNMNDFIKQFRDISE